ncbi:MAG: DsbA family protein, partial [Anaerolineae bacterium]|nr:DsbA family protein [Anaerolineae bacterium]
TMVDLEEKNSSDPSPDETPSSAEIIESPEEQEVKEYEESGEIEEVEKTSSNSSPWVLLIVGLLIGGLGGFYLRPLIFPEQPSVVAPLASVDSSDEINELDPYQSVMLAVSSGARHYQGDPDAPITIVEFGDFNCGYCARWAHEVLPRISEKYIQTGKVKMAFVHFPILGADSMQAAEATECAAQQDRFWDYHNTVYDNIGIGYTPANLTSLAKDIGLDTATFEQCLANFPETSLLEDDVRLSQVMGVRGTPAFLVNGIPLAGAYPYEEFEKIIDEILEGASSG